MGRTRTGSFRARLLALGALLAVLAAIAAVITGASGASGGAPSPGTAPSVPVRSGGNSHRHFWVVKSGQSLSEIAVREHQSADAIRRLNPGKDLGRLQTGQLVRVRP